MEFNMIRKEFYTMNGLYSRDARPVQYSKNNQCNPLYKKANVKKTEWSYQSIEKKHSKKFNTPCWFFKKLTEIQIEDRGDFPQLNRVFTFKKKKKPASSIILNNERLNASPLKSGSRQNVPSYQSYIA